jgi:MOSC domain-containing protein YiiM
MELISVNLGKPQPIKAKSGMTGIYKQPATEPIYIGELGLKGDAIIDVENHGGLDQAVYVFGAPDYAWWSAELGVELEPGTFGDNLTISGLESATYNVGDRLHIGENVVLEVTCPRIPCVTLATRMGDPKFVKRFRHAERFGLYCRVIKTGEVQAGDTVSLESYTGEIVGAIEMFRWFYRGHLTQEELQRLIAVPIASRDRDEFRARLTALMMGLG